MIDENYVKVKKTTPYYNFIRRVGFPSVYGILASLLLMDVVGAPASFWIAGRSFVSLSGAMEFAVLALIAPSLASTLILRYLLLRGDRILYFRRCLSLSLFSSALMVLSLLAGSLINLLYPPFRFPEDAFYLGLFFVLPLRFIVVFSMTSAQPANKFFSVIFEPLLTVAAAIQVLPLPPLKSILGFVISTIIGLLYCEWLLRYVEEKGEGMVRTSPLRLFRAFLEVMLEGDNASFEEMLEGMGKWAELEVTVIKFRQSSRGMVKGVLVVSNFHPGPFRNAGSSILPHLIKEEVEEETGGIAAVPHGISGHEMNLVSQRENRKVIRLVLDLLGSGRYHGLAGRFTRGTCDYASASLQFLGGNPLITLTISPRDMEDIPLEAASKIRSRIEGMGGKAVLIDSHNSIRDVSVITPEDVRKLGEAAAASLRGWDGKLEKLQFAASKISLDEFTPSQGVGPGGGVVFLVKTGAQVAAYLIFDANNMRGGLREELQAHLKGLGVAESEVLTSDSHVVNGLVASRLGYLPFGEGIPVSLLKERVREAVEDARGRLDLAEASCSRGVVKVKVLGLEHYRKLTELVYHASKRVVFSLIPILVLSLIIFSTLFI